MVYFLKHMKHELFFGSNNRRRAMREKERNSRKREDGKRTRLEKIIYKRQTFNYTLLLAALRRDYRMCLFLSLAFIVPSLFFVTKVLEKNNKTKERKILSLFL